jgi:RHH-type rel operon transcriptional repressor/antitoxin RelB
MLAIRVEDFLIEQVDTLAKLRHSNRSAIIREAIIRFIEDNEDIALAMSAKRKIKSTKSLKQLRKELGLDN